MIQSQRGNLHDFSYISMTSTASRAFDHDENRQSASSSLLIFPIGALLKNSQKLLCRFVARIFGFVGTGVSGRHIATPIRNGLRVVRVRWSLTEFG